MTSKEMEIRSGVPRANIRYYEAEGLLRPRRAKNGYREYSEEDLETLEKIKLLRRLGVSVEELRSLRSGTESLAAVLDRRLAELGGEQASLERVRQVCGAVRAEGVSFDALDAGRYLQDLDAPALPADGGGTWWKQPEAPRLPETDALPTVCSIPRRLTARLFDRFFLTMVLTAALCLGGYNPARASSLALSLGIVVLLGLLEPLFLRLFGTTPGKALMGLRLTGPDGRNLSYVQGVNRYVRMLWHGLGFYIPIWSLVQLYRSAARCANGEPQPWDEDVAYRAGDFRLWNLVGLLAAVAVVYGGAEAINCNAQLPPNRGELTVAEFAENFNRQANYVGLGLGGELDREGVWHETPDPPNVVTVNVWQTIPGADQFQYTVEGGRLTAVTLSGEVENSSEWYTLPVERMAVAMMAFAWAQEDAPFWTGPRRAQLETLEKADWEEGFTLRQGNLHITLSAQMENMAGTSSGYVIPMDETKDSRFAFTFTMALEE